MRFCLVSFFVLVSVSGFAQASEEKPDCEYTGRGEVYDLKGVHDIDKSYDLEAKRFPAGSGLYRVLETKTFTNKKHEVTTFFLRLSTKPFEQNTGNGFFSTYGVCLRPGHCMGHFKIGDFNGHFVTDFDENKISTVTFEDKDPSFVDEILTSKKSCPLK
jgi:hypothetical protein